MAWKKSKKTVKRKKPLSSFRKMVNKDAVKSIVKSTLNRNLETKIATYYVDGLRQYNITNDIASFRTNNYFYLSPTASGVGRGCIIAQGTGQGSRIGNEIQIVKATTSITMYPYSGNFATSQGENLDIMMYIVKFRNERGISNIQSLVETAFFQDGNSDLGLVGSLADTVMEINKDVIVQSKRIIGKLGPSTAGAIAVNAFHNNDYKYNLHYELDVTKYLNKKYTFNDTNDDPYTGATLLIFSPVPPQNQLEGAGGNTFFMTYRHQIYYKDA